MSKIAVLIGTRPGIIKMAPLVKELEVRQQPYYIIHTGQHYSIEMDRNILKDVGIGDVDYQIERPENCVTHAEQTAYMLLNIERILIEDRPEILLVCGDANTNFSGALAARKLHVRVGHVEAGLRSFDWLMPEEHNRVMIDHISDLLFAPTRLAKKYLENEKVKGAVFVVGNTIVDSVFRYRQDRKRWNNLRKKLSIQRSFVLLTLHREENVDNVERLRSIIKALNRIGQHFDYMLIFPMHPRTRKMLLHFDLMRSMEGVRGMHIVSPLRYLDFLNLTSMAQLVMTDSGGLQEETCILGIPCVTLRENTERPETLAVGSNIVAGVTENGIFSAFKEMLEKRNSNTAWHNPYGDGKAAKRIIDTCLDGRPNDEFIG